MCRISVIIPIYNAEERLTRTVGRVRENTVRDIEILLINDGSTDDTQRVCEEVAKQDARIRVIRQVNAGVGAARNRGLSLAKGEFIAFIDDDDLVPADYLEKLLLPMEQYNLDWVACGYSMISETGTGMSCKEERGVFPTDVVLQGDTVRDVVAEAVFCGPAGNNLASNCMGLYRRSVIEKAGLHINEEIRCGEDTLFNLEFAHHIRGFAYLKEALYGYVKRDGSAMQGKYRGTYMELEFRLLWELDALGKRYGEKWTDPRLNFFLNHLYSIFLHDLFLLEDRAERGTAYQKLEQELTREPIAGIYRKLKFRHADNAFIRLFYLLFKSKRYELMRHLWRLKNRRVLQK